MNLDPIVSVNSSPVVQSPASVKHVFDSVLSGANAEFPTSSVPLVNVYPKAQASGINDFYKFFSHGIQHGFVEESKREFFAAAIGGSNAGEFIRTATIFNHCVTLSTMVKRCVDKLSEGLTTLVNRG